DPHSRGENTYLNDALVHAPSPHSSPDVPHSVDIVLTLPLTTTARNLPPASTHTGEFALQDELVGSLVVRPFTVASPRAFPISITRLCYTGAKKLHRTRKPMGRQTGYPPQFPRSLRKQKRKNDARER